MIMNKQFEVLIVGGGGAGCILARSLAERCPQAQIGLLEAGGEGRRSPFLDHGLGSVLHTWAPESNWQLQTVPQAGLEQRVVPLTQGKVLGGGTSVNAMMYVHGDVSVVSEWHRTSGGHPNWEPQRFQAALIAQENCLGDGFDHALRGNNGPITIRRTPQPSASALAFLQAVTEVGYRRGDFNGSSQLHTADLMQLNLQANGQRCSTAAAYLQEPLPGNLTLLLNCQVQEIVMAAGKAEGVRLNDGRQLGADHVIVTAGAFQTPALLMASGIGDPQLLSGASIDCQVENSQVGLNLSDHMRAMVAYSSTDDPGTTEFLCEAALFTRSGLLDSPEPDIQINFSAGVDGFVPPEFIPTPAPKNTVIFVPVLARPLSRGSVRPLGSKLEDGFGIDPGYLNHPTDLKVYTQAVEIVRKLAKTEAMARFCDQELCPAELASGDYLKKYAQTIWHPVGSCAMGADPNLSACSPDFRLRGTDNVFVADASVLPSLPSGNPQAAIFAMASIASEVIADQLQAS